MELLRNEITAAITSPHQRFYLVETADMFAPAELSGHGDQNAMLRDPSLPSLDPISDLEKKLTIVYDTPLRGRETASALRKAWYFLGHDTSRVLILDGDSYDKFRIWPMPEAWDPRTAEAVAAIAILICEIRVFPKDLAMIIAKFKYCICDFAAAARGVETISSAVAKGHLCCLAKEFATRDICLSLRSEMCLTAASFGQQEVLEYLHFTQKIPLDENLCWAAIWSGNLATLRWVRKHGGTWNAKIVCEAALHGHLKMLQWALENGCPYEPREICVAAVRSGHLEIIEWLHTWLSDQDVTWPQTLCKHAATYGHRKVFEWLRCRGGIYDPNACMKDSCISGALNMVKLFHSLGAALAKNLILLAAINNRSRVVRWLYNNGCPNPYFDSQAYTRMAETGAIATLKELYEEEGFRTWSVSTHRILYTKGTSEVRKWVARLV